MGWDSNSHNRLTAPISLADLSYAAGTGAPYNLGAMIKSGTGFNMWARNKACRVINNPGIISDAERLGVLYGMNVVQGGIVNYGSFYNTAWSWNRPRGIRNTTDNPTSNDEWYRVLDFDGYCHNNYWQSGSGADYIYTIFNGYMHIPGALVSDGDTIYFDIQCRENSDADPYLGMLYPYDFAGATSPYDISTYYVGIAIIDSSNNVWIYSDPHISDFFSGTNLYTTVRTTISNSITNGALKIAPVLTSSRQNSWTSGFNGTIVNLNGAYLSATKVAQTANLQTNVTFSVSSSSVTLYFEVKNQTGSAVTLNDMWCYLLSDGAYMNEHDSGYSGPDYQGEGAVPYITRTWIGLTTRPDVYSRMWDGGSTNPDQLAARSYNAFSDFKAANGGSATIGNNTTRTWSKTFSYSGDEFGSYSNGAWALFCLAPSGNVFVREYSSY